MGRLQSPALTTKLYNHVDSIEMLDQGHVGLQVRSAFLGLVGKRLGDYQSLHGNNFYIPSSFCTDRCAPGLVDTDALLTHLGYVFRQGTALPGTRGLLEHILWRGGRMPPACRVQQGIPLRARRPHLRMWAAGVIMHRPPWDIMLAMPPAKSNMKGGSGSRCLGTDRARQRRTYPSVVVTQRRFRLVSLSKLRATLG